MKNYFSGNEKSDALTLKVDKQNVNIYHDELNLKPIRKNWFITIVYLIEMPHLPIDNY